MKLKNSNYDETQKNKFLWNSIAQILKTQKLKLWQNSKTLVLTKLKYLNFDKTQKLKLWQKSKTQIVTKLELCQISMYEKKKKLQTVF